MGDRGSPSAGLTALEKVKVLSLAGFESRTVQPVAVTIQMSGSTVWCYCLDVRVCPGELKDPQNVRIQYNAIFLLFVPLFLANAVYCSLELQL